MGHRDSLSTYETAGLEKKQKNKTTLSVFCSGSFCIKMCAISVHRKSTCAVFFLFFYKSILWIHYVLKKWCVLSHKTRENEIHMCSCRLSLFKHKGISYSSITLKTADLLVTLVLFIRLECREMLLFYSINKV